MNTFIIKPDLSQTPESVAVTAPIISKRLTMLYMFGKYPNFLLCHFNQANMLANHYFAIFNLPVSFEIDNNALAHQYRELQRAFHPDKFAAAPEQERLLSLQQAAQINTAYQTLKNPLSRAQYLLHLHNAAETNEHMLQMDGEFLMEQIELRESLSEIKQLHVLNRFLSQIEQKTEQMVASLKAQFQQDDYVTARNTVKKLQFFDKLHKEILLLEEQLAC